MSTDWSASNLPESEWTTAELTMLNESKPKYSASYTVYVDMSAKLEQCSKASAVAVSKGESTVCLVSARVKQRLRQTLLNRYSAKTVKYRAFAILVYAAIKDELLQIRQVVLDQDYTGNEAEVTVRNVLLALLRRQNPDISATFVRFQRVRGSNANRLARDVYLGRLAPTRVICFSELESIMGK